MSEYLHLVRHRPLPRQKCGKKVTQMGALRPSVVTTNSVGLFQNLLNFQIKRGDTILREYLNTAAKNARYTSAPIQNQLIECAGNVIANKLISKINESGVFAILADEATDCSNKEQMALIIRFVDRENVIREEFLQFIYLDSGLMGVDVKADIPDALRG